MGYRDWNTNKGKDIRAKIAIKMISISSSKEIAK